MIAGILIALFTPILPLQDDLDTIVLEKKDKEISCRVLYEDDEVVIARSRRKNREYERAEIQEIHSIERSLREFLARYDKIDSADVESLSELALFCESRDLHGEARSLWIRVLTLDPENEQAWTKVGGSKGRKGWRLKVRGRYYTIGQLRERVSDWKNAMELPTAHFLLKTDISPERALDLTLDLERAYLKFYDLLGEDLRLYVFDWVPEVHVFSDPGDYPVPPTPGDSWFSFTANTVYVNWAKDRNVGEVVYDFAHLLLNNAFRRTLGKTGGVAPWARDGMSQMFAIAVRPSPGHVRWDFDAVYRPYFLVQATDEDGLSLKEVLRSSHLAFQDMTVSERNSAYSYTLTHFLLHAEGGKYRPAFAEFLRSSFAGKSSTSHFEKIFDVKLKDLEGEWQSYVRKMAGA